MHLTMSFQEIVDWPNPRSLRKAAKKVQLALIHEKIQDAEPEVQALPLFRLVQEEFVPSQAAIAQGLIEGRYKDFL